MKGDTEIAAGADPLDELLADLDATEEEWASLYALHGKGGIWDNFRKNYLSEVKMQIRAKAAAAGEKVTEAYLDDAGHADAGYRAFMEEAKDQRTRFGVLEAKREKIFMRCYRGQAMLKVAARWAA